MPELTFDEFGMPVWTNGQDASGTDPEPVSAAIAAVNAIGAPGGIPLPGSLPEVGPGAESIGAPPAETRANALINPANDALEYPSPDAVVLPEVGAANPAFQNLNPITLTQEGLASGPAAPLPGVPLPAPGVPAPAVAPPAAPTGPAPLPLPQGGRMNPVQTANAAVDNAGMAAAGAMADQQLAANEAQRQLYERRAAAQEEFARRQAESDAQFQVAREQARVQAEQETAKWMADLEDQAKKEPNPKRWFANQSSFGKAMWLLSLAFGSKAAATAPGVQNIGLAMIREEIDKDMGEQKARLAREMEVMRTRGAVMDRRNAQRLQFLKDDHSIRSGQLLALEKAALERANAPGSADDQAAMAAAHSWLAQQRLQVASTRAQQAFQANEAKLARGHAAWMQQNAQTFAAEQAAIGRAEQAAKDALDRMAKIQASQIDAQNKAAEAKANTFTVDPASGVQLALGGKTAPLAINVKDEGGRKRQEQIIKLSEAAQEVTAELQVIREAVSSGSFADRLLQGDPALVSAVNNLGYAKAKENDPRGIVTDKDFQAGVKSALGVDMISVGGRLGFEAKSFALGDDAKAKLLKFIDHKMQEVETRTSAKLNAYVPLEEKQGGSIVWRAKNRNPLEAQTESLEEMTARVTGQAGPAAPEPVTMEDLKRGQEMEKAGAEGALPKYQRIVNDPNYSSTQEVVSEAKDSFGGGKGGVAPSPERIIRLSEGYQSKVQGDSRARLEILQATEDAVNAVKKREEDVKEVLVAKQVRQGAITLKQVAAEMKRGGLDTRDPAYINEIMEAVKAVTPYGKNMPKVPQ